MRNYHNPSGAHDWTRRPGQSFLKLDENTLPFAGRWAAGHPGELRYDILIAAMAHFLVVEDFPPMATLLANAIRREGHSVERVGSVATALKSESYFQHAVLDVDLPDGDGVQLARQLLDDRRVGSVLFFTASRDVDLLTRAAKLGRIVDKAAGYDRLIAAVRQLASDSYLVKRAAVAGSADTFTTHAPGWSGTRRKIDPGS